MATSGKNKNDSLGNRMKEYENIFRNHLPKRSYVIIRIDGKAFHSFTKGLKKPFDDDLIADMDATTKFLCENIQGAKLGYVQSDEISIVITDFETFDTQSWFENNIQKMCSISASLATSKFNQLRMKRDLRLMENIKRPDDVFIDFSKVKLAQFDSRVFLVPNRSEVMNYLLWRQNDAVRNSISMVAQSIYSHKELHGKSTDQMQELTFQKGVNWNDLEGGKKRGRLFAKTYFINGVDVQKMTLEQLIKLDDGTSEVEYGFGTQKDMRNKLIQSIVSSGKHTIRNKWEEFETPMRFTENNFSLLTNIIPNNE